MAPEELARLEGTFINPLNSIENNSKIPLAYRALVG